LYRIAKLNVLGIVQCLNSAIVTNVSAGVSAGETPPSLESAVWKDSCS
jgi:hypothetical protein